MSLAEQLPEYALYANTLPCYDPEEALEDFNALTPEQHGKLCAGILVAVGSNVADKEFEKASISAATAVQTIEKMFITLTASLNRIGDAQDFLEEFAIIQKIFREVVKDSHSLAVTISQYAESFDAIIVKFCADKELTVEQRIARIEKFIAKADSFKKDAGNMDDRFTHLKDRFTKFVGKFSSWASGQEGKDKQGIERLQAEIQNIDEQIAAIETALRAVSVVLGATLPITGILTAAFPPAAPLIIGLGAAIAGISLASLVGLTLGRNILMGRRLVNEHEIWNLQAGITKIKAARTQLEEEGQVALEIFINNIIVIQNIWTIVVNDATEILNWLQDGADDVNMPKYMKISLEKGVEVYSKMGKYLRGYADGVTETVKSFKE